MAPIFAPSHIRHSRRQVVPPLALQPTSATRRQSGDRRSTHAQVALACRLRPSSSESYSSRLGEGGRVPSSRSSCCLSSRLVTVVHRSRRFRAPPDFSAEAIVCIRSDRTENATLLLSAERGHVARDPLYASVLFTPLCQARNGCSLSFPFLLPLFPFVLLF